MKVKYSSLLLGLLFSGGIFAQAEARRFSLAEAEEYAAKHAYTVQDKQLEFIKAKKTIMETAAMGLPQISASFGYSYNAQIPQTPIPAQFFDPDAAAGEFTTVAFGVAHQNQAVIQVKQLLLDGSYFVALQASKVFKETKRLDKENAEIEARKNVAQSYYGVLVAEKTQYILEQNLKVLSENFKETRKLYENGFVEDQDVDQLELLINNLQNNLANTNRQLNLAHQLLKFNMGMSLGETIELSTTLQELITPAEIALGMSLDSLKLEDHITYRTTLINERAAELTLANEKAKFYPSLSAFLTHSQSNFGNEINDVFNFDTYWIPGTTIGASLSWDVFTGLARHAKVQKAKIDVERVSVAKAATESQLDLAFERALSDYKYAIDNYNNQVRNVELSEKIRNKTLLKYKEGLSSSLELSQSENQLLQTQTNYINAISNALNSKEALEYALGK
jgi:outer membrane protein